MPFEKGTFIPQNITDSKHMESSRYGFINRWRVASDYQIVDGLLLPHPSATWRDSYPITQPNISARLAQINEGNEKALLAFARQYGGLGFANILPIASPYAFSWGGNVSVARMLSEPVFHADMPEEFHDRMTKKYFGGVLRELIRDKKAFKEARIECGLDDKKIWEAMAIHGGGDPLSWIWAHVRTLNICCTLTEYIQDDDEELALSFLKTFNPEVEDLEFLKCALAPLCDIAYLHRSTRHAWFMPRDFRNWTVLDFARYVRRQLINRNMEGLRLAIEPKGKNEGSFFQYRSLIEVAYWHLHNRVIDGKMRRCRECGAFFVQRDKREIFCPEPKTPKGESHCAVLNRSTRNMKKHREKLRRKRKPEK